MKVGKCIHCDEGIRFVRTEVDALHGKWVHVMGARKCGDGELATPCPGTVKKSVDDVQVTHPGLG